MVPQKLHCFSCLQMARAIPTPIMDDAVKAQHKVGASSGKGLAPEALAMVRRIYAIEKAVRDAKLTAEQRYRLRHEKARPIWTELKTWLDTTLGAAPPGSLTGKALNYLASEWPLLIRVLDGGRRGATTTVVKMPSAHSPCEKSVTDLRHTARRRRIRAPVRIDRDCKGQRSRALRLPEAPVRRTAQGNNAGRRRSAAPLERARR